MTENLIILKIYGIDGPLGNDGMDTDGRDGLDTDGALGNDGRDGLGIAGGVKPAFSFAAKSIGAIIDFTPAAIIILTIGIVGGVIANDGALNDGALN